MNLALDPPGAAPAAATVLHPGDVVVLQRGDAVETLLGSCVTIVLADPRRSLAAACHVVHASAGPDATHGPTALALMLAALRARGIDPTRGHAWVVGGGHMFPQLRGDLHLPDVGQANTRWALRALRECGVTVIGQDVGGCVYRRLHWTVGLEPPHITTVELEAPT